MLELSQDESQQQPIRALYNDPQQPCRDFSWSVEALTTINVRLPFASRQRWTEERSE